MAIGNAVNVSLDHGALCSWQFPGVSLCTNTNSDTFMTSGCLWHMWDFLENGTFEIYSAVDFPNDIFQCHAGNMHNTLVLTTISTQGTAKRACVSNSHMSWYNNLPFQYILPMPLQFAHLLEAWLGSRYQQIYWHWQPTHRQKKYLNIGATSMWLEKTETYSAYTLLYLQYSCYINKFTKVTEANCTIEIVILFA